MTENLISNHIMIPNLHRTFHSIFYSANDLLLLVEELYLFEIAFFCIVCNQPAFNRFQLVSTEEGLLPFQLLLSQYFFRAFFTSAYYGLFGM